MNTTKEDAYRLLTTTHKTLQEIGTELGVSRQRIQQIASQSGISCRVVRKLRTMEKAAPERFRVTFTKSMKKWLYWAGFLNCHMCHLWLLRSQFSPAFRQESGHRKCSECNRASSSKSFRLKRLNRDICTHTVWVKSGPGLQTCSNCRLTRSIKSTNV